MPVKFKIHETPEGNTRDLSLRISAIENGWVIKAGGPPYFCNNEVELMDAVNDVIKRYVDKTSEDIDA
jgi:hypothetical protein